MEIYKNLEIQTICKASETNPRNSEASIVQLRDGRLLLAWQRYEASGRGSEDNASSTISMMDSADGGRSWGNFRKTVPMTEGWVNVYSPNFLRLKDGGIALFFMRYMQLEAGKPSLTNAYVIRSYDEGDSWSEETALWERSFYTFSNDCILRLSGGRLVFPLCYNDTPVWSGEKESISVTTMVSDDDGVTWKYSDQRITLPIRGRWSPSAPNAATAAFLWSCATSWEACLSPIPTTAA